MFGVPRRLISDRGTFFTSLAFKKFKTDKSINLSSPATHVLNAVAAPRANDQEERYNKVIVDALPAKSVGSADNKYDDHMPDVQWGMNNTFNKGFNRTTFKALFGIRLASSNDSRILA